MKTKIILDPSSRRMENIFSADDLNRLHTATDVIWGKDEPMPEAEIEKVRDEIVAIICGIWRHGEVNRFPHLGAIKVGGGFPSQRAWTTMPTFPAASVCSTAALHLDRQSPRWDWGWLWPAPGKSPGQTGLFGRTIQPQSEKKP
jgi:hypothetical protein